MPLRFAEIVWPKSQTYWLANARVPACFLPPSTRVAALLDAEGLLDLDLMIEAGVLTRVEPAGVNPKHNMEVVDIGGRQVWPALIDIHTHLDKGHTVVRNPNHDGTFLNARLAAQADRLHWSETDLRRRIDFGLRCARSHGVAAIRTHIDTYPETLDRSWAVIREFREAWRGRIELQAVSLCPVELLKGEFGERVASTVAQAQGLLGGVTRPAIGDHGAPTEDMDEHLDRLFSLAKDRALEVDLHVDETHDPAAATLPYIARAALRHGYEGRVVCGHCCSLANQIESEIDRTLDLVAEADISIVTLPTVNMYLQDRKASRTPRWRGVTVVHEMLKRGVKVAVAGDNCRDSFYAYGDHDVLDTYRQAVRILHLDHPLTDTPSLVTTAAAAIGGFTRHGRLQPGQSARFVVFNARSLNEIVSRPHPDRVIFENGARIEVSLPDYAELWADTDAMVAPGNAAC